VPGGAQARSSVDVSSVKRSIRQWLGPPLLRDCDIDLRHANLRGANLTNTNLAEANLSGARLEGANLRNANLFASVLERTQGLERAQCDRLTHLPKSWRCQNGHPASVRP